MQKTPNKPRQHWGHDTIYCEAICSPEDVFCEGSEDEDYDDSRTRRIRYEAAGQRFLNGETPFILSASLDGPFDQLSGWVNPWRSRRMVSDPTTKPDSRSARVPKRKKTVPESRPSEIQEGLDCHLPSPESLKQASIEPHPFLEQGDVARVQEWRDTVQLLEENEDDIWALGHSYAADERPSAKKRRGKSSDWLQRVSKKKRKTDSMELASIDTPLQRRSRTVPAPSNGTSSNAAQKPSFNTPFQSAPELLPPSTNRSSLKRNRSRSALDYDLAGEDELMDPNSSFASVSGRIGSPVKRISPKRAIRGANGPDAIDSEDELAPEKSAALKAAATLSSPVSIKGDVARVAKSKRSAGKKQSSSCAPSPCAPRNQLSGTGGRKAERFQSLHRSRENLKSDIDTDMGGVRDEQVTAELSPGLETQQDQSFCFKMRPKERPAVHTEVETASKQRESSPVSSLTSFDSKSWSGLSSLQECDARLEIQNTPVQATESTDDTTNNAEHDLHHNDPVTTDANNGTTSVDDLKDTADEGVAAISKMSSLDGEVPSDTDDSSELSDLSSVQLQQVDVLGEAVRSSPSCAHSEETAGPISTAQEPQTSTSGGDKGTSNSDSSSSSADSDDAATEDRDEKSTEVPDAAPESKPQQTTSQSDNVTCTPMDASMTNGQGNTAKTCAAESPPEQVEAGPEDLILDKSVESSSLELSGVSHVPSKRFSLKEAFQRLVPISPWHRSPQCEQTESPTPSAESKPSKQHMELAKLAKSATGDTCEDGIETSLSQPPSSTGKEAVAEDWFSCDSAPEELMHPTIELETSAGRQTSRSPSECDNEETASLVSSSQQLAGQAKANEEDDANDGSLLAESQQSPWSKSQSTQWLSLNLGKTQPSSGYAQLRPATPSFEEASSTPQTPWAASTITASFLEGSGGQSHLTEDGARESINASQIVRPPVAEPSAEPVTPLRASTPESQLPFQPFSAFMTPSPERRARQRQRDKWRASGCRLPSTQGILASAMKNPWNSAKSDRCVSWAPLPGEDDTACSEGSGHEKIATDESEAWERPASPPPMVAVEDLPTSKDADFQGHFNVVARRASAGPARILPTDSQQTLGSPSPYGMAEAFVTTDGIGRCTIETPPKAFGDDEAVKEDDEDYGVDLTEQVFQDLQDLLQPWDLDAELDQARREPGIETSHVGVRASSPY